MQLPPIERISHPRPSGLDAVTVVVAKVAAVAPVQPVSRDVQSSPPTPSVINLVNQTGKLGSNDPVYSNVADPMRRVLDPPTEPQDWTIHKPEPEKVEKPAPEPLSKVLMEHIKSMWTASADAVKVESAKTPLETEPVETVTKTGSLGAEGVTYSPGKITKPEKM
jgi:hypothetical protein